MYSNIPHEIILYILLLTNIKCHCCYKSLNTNLALQPNKDMSISK